MRRVLLIRTSALGDVVHCLPALTSLRRHLPEARIGWLVEEAMAPVLKGHPDLDEVLTVNLRGWRRRPLAASTLGGVGRFLSRLDSFAPEVVLDLMGNHKAGILGALALADHRIGLARPFRREGSSAVWLSRSVDPQAEHAVDRALAVVRDLGVSPGPADFGGDKLFPGAPEPPPAARGAFAVIQAGAGWGNKVYPPELWGAVARGLEREAGLPCLVPVAPGEEHLARAVEAAGGGAARTVAAAGLPALAALLRRARLVLGGDTGPVHLAHALGTPVLCLMGPTDPAATGPYGAPERALWVRLPCSFCHKRFRETKACLLRIAPERVVERAREVLAPGGPTPS